MRAPKARAAARQLVSICLLAAPAATAFGAAFETAVLESSEGYYQIRWEAEEAVRLVESTSADFTDPKILYAGADTARVVSGKPDGVWYYRLESRASGAVLGEPLEVTVRHHSLARAFGFFAVGAVVFLATLGLILVAGRGLRAA